jgi:hypothetical protein
MIEPFAWGLVRDGRAVWSERVVEAEWALPDRAPAASRSQYDATADPPPARVVRSFS